MEAKALHRHIGSSPRKMRLVIDLIRGKSYEEAEQILKFAPQHAARYAEKVLRSAYHNLLVKAEQDEENETPDTADVYVKEVYVNAGPHLKRMLPAPMGRAFRIRKRSNHLTIVVAKKS